MRMRTVATLIQPLFFCILANLVCNVLIVLCLAVQEQENKPASREAPQTQTISF
jgi:hypothetical protein